MLAKHLPLGYSLANVCHLSSRIAVSWTLCLLFASVVFAQQNPTPPPAAKSTGQQSATAKASAAPDYSNEGSVIEQARTSFTFQTDGSYVELQYARIRVQNPQAVQAWGQLIFTYSAANDKISADFVRVHKSDGHVAAAGPDAVQDLSSPVERVAPMYTDIRQIHITVPDLNVGDTLEYQIRSVTTQPLVPGQFFTAWSANKQLITLDEAFQVDLPAGRDLHVKTSNGIAAPDMHDQNGRRIYTWHSSFTKRPDESSDSDKKKKEKEPEVPDVQISTFSSWAQLGQWYADLQKPRASVSPAIHAKADELVKGFSTPAEKANAIYNYVSKNIRYVSLSFGLGRYQPHPADDVLSNQYGDCKDKATLLEALLAAENIQSYPVLINSQRKIDPDVPSPVQFDHVINIVILNGKSDWADTTPGVTPFGLLVAPLRDKQALAMPLSAPASLQKTPLDPPFTPATTLSVDGQVDSFGRLQGNLSISDNGDFAIIIRTALHLIPQDRWQQMADRLAQGLLGSEAAKTTNPHFANAENLDQPLVFTAQFSEPDFLDMSRKEVNLSIPFVAITANDIDKPDKNSTDPLKIGSILSDKEIWKVTLPSQFSATLPVPVHVTRDYAVYESSYSSAAGTVTVERDLTLRNAELAPSRYDDWEAFRNTIVGDKNQSVQLANASPGNGSIPSAASADDIYSAAVDAERSHNYLQAATLYAAAAAKDPDREGIWSTLGHVYLEAADYKDAIPALQQAISKNAYDQYAYNNLGLAYQGLGHYDDAVKEFLKQIEINPLDQYAHGNLASLYLQQKKYDSAQKEYQLALKITPNNYNLNIGLGTADLGLHQDDAALAAFHIVLEKAPSPETWNNVAYFLADNNSHLDLAEHYSEDSIRAIEAQLSATSLDTVGPTQAALVQSLATFWDTMGWIKLKQGNLQAAESYIHSAWFLCDDATIGDHLGQIYEKEGRRDDAAHAYALALTYPNPPVETRGRLVALVGDKRADTEVSFAHGSARRDISLPNPQKINAVAEFWVLLSGDFDANQAKVLNAPDKVDAKFIAVQEGLEIHPRTASADKSPDAQTNDKLRDAFRAYIETLRAAKFPYSFPEGEPGKLLVRGALTCDTTTQPSCTFTVYSAEQALRVSLMSSALAGSH
jgi:tetratricopeptide (TPR) repeat protein